MVGDCGGAAEVEKCLDKRAARDEADETERSTREEEEGDKAEAEREEEERRGGEGEEEREGGGGGACLVGGASVADVRRTGEQPVRARIGQAVGGRLNGFEFNARPPIWTPLDTLRTPGNIENGFKAMPVLNWFN